MKYSLVAISALATAAAAQPQFLNTAFDVVEGQAFELKYDGCETTCTILIQNGESTDLKDVKTLSTTATDGSLSVNFDDLPTDTYNFKIVDNGSGEANYSEQFQYEGSVAATTSAAATSETAASTSAASSASSKASSSAAATTSLTTFSSATPVTTKEATSTEATSTPETTVESTKTAANSTTLSTKSATKSSEATSETSSAEATASATTVPDSGANRMTSSLALIAGAVAAMVYLN